MTPHLEIPESMKRNGWVASLRPAAREALLANSEAVTFRAGQMLYRSRDDTGVFYGLVDGFVKISTVRPDGQEAILTVIEPGNWFGEMSMVDHLPRTHDATAIGRVRLLGIRAATFDRLMEQVDFSRGVADLLAARMRLLFAVFEDATLHTTRERIARRILHLCRGDATLSAEPRTTVQVSQSVLAMMVGITRQTLSTELLAMAEAGAIVTRYGGIEVLDMDRLQSFAQPPALPRTRRRPTAFRTLAARDT